MRESVRKQLPLVEPAIEHEHAGELHGIRRLLDEQPSMADLVHADLVRGLKTPHTGRRGKLSAEQVLMALLIKQMNDFSYEVLAYHLADSRTYRAVCGFGIGDKLPSGKTLQRDIKKIGADTLEAINRILVASAAASGIEKGRKVRVDCTVVESNIHHPTDSSLLWDCVRVLSRWSQRAVEISDVVVANHCRRAKRRALGILNARTNKQRKKLYRDLLKVAHKTCADAVRALEALERGPTADPLWAMVIEAQLQHYLVLARQVIAQTERRVLGGESVPPQDKIVSIFEPHTDIIIKDRRDTLFGHKVTIAGGVSGLLTDLVIERGNPADVTLAERMITRQREIFGRAPRQAAFDGGFASKANLTAIKELGVKDVAFAKKRGLAITEMAKSTWVYKKLRDFRAGIEGMISFLKRCFAMGRCTWRGFASFKAYAWSSVLTANFLLVARRAPPSAC
jgi:IS5 family transposase